MTKSELIDQLSRVQLHLSPRDIESSVNAILEHMSQSLIGGDRIEIRGFGSIGLRYRASRTGRNPKTGDRVEVHSKQVPYFRPGNELKDLINRELHDDASSLPASAPSSRGVDPTEFPDY